jgi:hypothetical protein
MGLRMGLAFRGVRNSLGEIVDALNSLAVFGGTPCRQLRETISHPVYRLFGLSGGYAVAMSGSLVVLGEWLSGAGRDGLWLFAGYFMAMRQTEGLS